MAGVLSYVVGACDNRAYGRRPLRSTGSLHRESDFLHREVEAREAEIVRQQAPRLTPARSSDERQEHG